MSTNIVLIRHGQTAWNVERRWQGHAAVPLDTKGRHQAEQLGQYLATTRPPNLRRMYSSDLIRARQTAAILNQYLHLPLRYDRRLREIDAGEWQGMTREEIRAWDPERLAEVMQDRYARRNPGGESYQDLANRGCAALQDYARCHPGECVLVVTHGGLIRETLRCLVQAPLPDLVPNTSMTSVHCQPDTNIWSALEVAITPHLTPNDEMGTT